jgi:FkbM family methyltransferase
VSRLEVGSREVRRANWLGLKPAIAKLLTAAPVNPLLQFAARTVLPRSVAHRLPLSRRSVTYRLDCGSSFALLDPLHDIVARDVYWGQGKATSSAERHKLACLERLGRDADLFIDVGAYAGICSLIAARANPRLKVIAYELVPENYLLLVRNVVENDLVGRIDTRLRGLGECHSEIKIPVALGAASYMTSLSLGSSFAEGVSIPVVPLDEDIVFEKGRVLIKIDVEGFEDLVIKGAAQLVRNTRPDIICEVLPGGKETARTIGELLSPLGYRWYCFEDRGLEPRERLEPGAEMRDWLFTCRPEIAHRAEG